MIPTAIYKKTGKWYTGWVLEIPGVNTQGKTITEVRKNLKEALSEFLEAQRGQGKSFRGSSFKKESIIL